jgi:mono/diheme cytochrome c family protein
MRFTRNIIPVAAAPGILYFLRYMLHLLLSISSTALRQLTMLGLMLSALVSYQANAQQPAKTPSANNSAYSTDKQVVAKGQVLFQNNCATCHNFRQKGIGPNLAGVTAEVTPAWLRTFIRNAPEQIGAGDKRATALFKEYNQYMPDFTTLQETDLDAVLAYINANQDRESLTAKPDNMGEALTDPIPTKLAKSGLRLTLTEVMTAPASATAGPLARINKMEVLPGRPDRLFIEDLRGKLYEMTDNTLKVYMDIAQERPNFIHAPGLATGFGSYAFHPDFNKNGLLYTTHTEKAGTAPADFAYADSIKVTLQWVLTEWTVRKPAAATFAGKGRELLRVNVVSPIHGVQEITFNPLARPGTADYGLLYMGIGDGGATENGYDFLCNGKNRPWGSVLRIDPKGTNSQNGRYGVPASNPYAKDKDRATVREIFCRGFRNPNRIYWTPDGKMLITDIGQAQAEELNIGVAGGDYGWPNREGTFMINPHGNMGKVYPLPANDASFRYTYPVAQYDHDEGNAISGGFVYSGTAIPLLTGKYVFGDVVNGRVYYVDSKALALGRQATIQELELAVGNKLTTFRELSNSKKTDLRIGTGLNHELFLYTKTDGKIYQVSGCERTAQ